MSENLYGEGSFIVVILVGIVVILLPIALMRWIFRIDEMVKYQCKTAELLDQIRRHLTKSNE